MLRSPAARRRSSARLAPHTRNLSASITLYPTAVAAATTNTPQLLLLPLAATAAAAAAAATAAVTVSRLLVLLAAQLGVLVGHVDVELVGALHNLLALAGRHVVRDLHTHTGR